MDSRNVFDLAGNQMIEDLVWNFTTSSERTNNIMGQIVDMNGYTLSGAVISLEGTTFITETDENGEFLINSVPVGNYTLIVKKRGYEKESREVLVNPYQPTMVPQIAMDREEEEFNPIWAILAIIIIVLVLVIFVTLIRRSQKSSVPPEEGGQAPLDQYPQPSSMGDQMYPYGAATQSQIPPPYYPPGYPPPPAYPPEETPPSKDDATEVPAHEEPHLRDETTVGPAQEEPASETPSTETPLSEEKPPEGSQEVQPVASQEVSKTKPDGKVCINCRQPMPPDTAICPYCQWDQNKPLPPPPPQYSGY
jgi:hypothetical protein